MKLAIFDIDGTLTQTMGLTDALFVETVSEVIGVELPPQDWSSYPHVTDSGVVQHLFAQVRQRAPDAHELAAIRARYMARLQRELATALAVPGALGALRSLAESAEWTVAIATGNWREPAHHKLSVCGVPFAGMPMATADDSHDRTQILASAIQRSGSPERVVYFGDRRWDAEAADALGIGFIAVGAHLPNAKLRVMDYTDLAAVWRALDAL